MAATGVGFRWLDILEKEFDKAFVELDTSIGEIDVDDAEIAYAARQKMATLSSCFAQLSHKAQTIFQNSAKVEAELVDMRTELVEARAASQSESPAEAGGGEDSARRARAEAAQLARENGALRETVLALHADLFGARLAAKYLDKELAGRIQQLQLLGREVRAELRDSLWRQLEAEILLQRHKTVVRACRSVKAQTRRARPPAPPAGGRARGVGQPRLVLVQRSPHQGLGISITGGREHGVPVLISELEAGGPAALTGALYVGDAILAVNDVDLRQACHKEAVSALQGATGDCALFVQFVAADSDSDHLSDDDDAFHYPLYPTDDMAYGGGRLADDELSGAVAVTPTAPRTPDFNRSMSDDYSDFEQTVEEPQHLDTQEFYRSTCRLDNSAPAYQPQHTAYQDYNSINNNATAHHSILDMDDNTIKIQTEVQPLDNNISLHLQEQPYEVNDSANIEAKVVLNIENAPKDELVSSKSITNSESTNSPMQTSSDNIINSSEISRKIIDNSVDSQSSTETADNELVLATSEEQDHSGNGTVKKNRTRMVHRPDKASKKVNEKNSVEIGVQDIFDHTNEKTQNVGYMYPKLVHLQHFGLGKYQGLLNDLPTEITLSSSNNSMESTPVHGRRPPIKTVKKRKIKSGDWRSKGAYQSIDNQKSSDIDSPVRQVKIDKDYKEDSFHRMGVNTIQHIFNKVHKEDRDEAERVNLTANLAEEISKKIDVNSILREQLAVIKNTQKYDLGSESLITFTPKHADSEDTKVDYGSESENNISEAAQVLVEKLITTLNEDVEKIPSESSALNVSTLSKSYNEKKSRIKYNDEDTHSSETKNSIHSRRQDRKTSAPSLGAKSRGFRIGSAKRVPPPPDIVHIPLKIISGSEDVSDDKDQGTNDNTEKPESNVDNCDKTDNQEKNNNPEQLAASKYISDYDGNLIYNNGNPEMDRSIDETLKLALSKLELSMLRDDDENYSLSSKSGTLKDDQSKYSHRSFKRHSSVASYLITDSNIIQGDGDPDFGTPV